VDFALAREIATREGIKAVVDGTVTELGGSYVLSARLVSAQTGEEMGTFRETAEEEKEMIPAIGRLSRKLRSKVGESLRAIQKAPALDQVSTSSLPALQKYVASTRAMQLEGDFAKGVRLLEEAISLDTTFAMAYRRLGTELNNRSLDRPRVQALLQKAYDHRDRLSDAERYLAISSYFSSGPQPDPARAISALESLVDLQPENFAALNNLANEYRFAREFAKAEVMARRGLTVQRNVAVLYNNLVFAQQAQGKLAAAESTAALAAANLPQHPVPVYLRAGVLMARGALDSAFAALDSLHRSRAGDVDVRSRTGNLLSSIEAVRGRLGESLRWARVGNQAAREQGSRDAPLHSLLDEAEYEAWFRDAPDRALVMLDRALEEFPLDSLPEAERPYGRLVRLYALVGRPDRARTVMAGFERRAEQARSRFDRRDRRVMTGLIALAERRYDEAQSELRAADEGTCTVCVLPDLARAYDLAGNADSAIAVFARYIDGPSEPGRLVFVDWANLAGAHKRLGQLYEAKGEREKAASHYARFVELWKDADPELQPRVREVRERLARLQRAEGR
jgi:tetratricopeptide (TPR) repeat protein